MMLRPLLTSFLSPDGDEARGWAEEELAKAKYSEPGPGLIERLGQWILDRLRQINLDFGTDASWTGSVTIVLLIAIIAALAIFYGRLRPGALAQSTRPGMILDDDRGEAALIKDAKRAHAAGDFSSACVDYYRACIRILDSRGLITASPGMTALEAAHDGYAATGLPLGPAARVFDSVLYGATPASSDEASMMADLVERSAGSVRV